MYSDNPELSLRHKGSMLIKPSEEDKSIKTKEHDMKIQDLKIEAEIEDHKWRSCCFSLHAESSVFFAKLLISVLTIILCSYQLINLTNCNYQSLYSSILSSVITFWLNKK